MSQGKPATELPRRFVRRLAVEGHQGSRASRRAGDLRAPLVEADTRNLDVVLAAVDDLVKKMHDHFPPY